MSAIWGYIDYEAEPSIKIEQTMQAVYREKCKIDRYSFEKADRAVMGCGIQYITSESVSESLPIVDKDNKLIFTADCILDNREELISLLEANDADPDGTIMYKAFLKWGINCVNYFRGLFSMAVYSGKDDKLFLATDQNASRCLYYYKKNNKIYFSSLIKPILSVNDDIGYNDLYFKDYLTAPWLIPKIVPDETPYEGIVKVINGTYIEITKEKINIHKYWDENKVLKRKKTHSAQYYGYKFKEVYSDCVYDALRTDGNVGIMMSSGFDSGSVGALAASHLSVMNKKLYTYTYVPAEKTTLLNGKNNVLNETEDVKKIVAMYSNMIPHFLNNKGRNCIDEIDEELDILEFPFKAYINMPNLKEIYKAASDAGCKVLLTGQCGNMTVSHGYIDDVLYDLYSKKKYISFLYYLNNYSKTVKESRKKALRNCIFIFEDANKQYKEEKIDFDSTNVFLSESVRNDYPAEARYRSDNMDKLKSAPIPEKTYRRLVLNQPGINYLGELETKMGLKYGIVIRDATKDIRMLEFCYHLPYKFFAYRGTPRWLIRGNLSDMLPKEIIDKWMRYGVQNSDYISRIQRDMPSVLLKLSDLNNSRINNEWVDLKKVGMFVSELTEAGILENYSEFADLVYIYILDVFLKM